MAHARRLTSPQGQAWRARRGPGTGNTIQRIAKVGGVSVAVATASGPSGVALDSSFVYFANQGDGTIRKIAK